MGRLLIILMLAFAACNRTSSEQREKFDACQKDLRGNTGLKNLIGQFELESRFGPEVSSDIRKLSLEEIADKYDMTDEDIELFVKLVCTFVPDNTAVSIEDREGSFGNSLVKSTAHSLVMEGLKNVEE